MLEDFMDKQPLFCDEILRNISNKKISHAYMIETNNYSLKDELILSFVKKIFSSYYQDNDDFDINTLIDNNSFSDFMIVEPDGAFIKKEQVLEIKERFKTTSFQNAPRIYLIKQADKLNKHAANSLLKFLEEPEGNVIAILEVDNRYKVLETIRSRCQIFSFTNHDNNKEIENIDLIEKIIEVLENKKRQAIAYLPQVLENDYRNREFWNETFMDMILIYESTVRKINNLEFYDYGDILDFIISKNDISDLIYKIGILFDMTRNLNYNLNVNMMLDQLIILFNRK